MSSEASLKPFSGVMMDSYRSGANIGQVTRLTTLQNPQTVLRSQKTQCVVEAHLGDFPKLALGPADG